MMENGKKIGALVVVAAIGLISYVLLGNSDNETTVSDGEIAVDTVSPAVQEVVGTVLAVSDDSQVYEINMAESEIYWRIYRAGALARLGHNHVISISELDGSLTLGSDPANSVWELSFPVDALIIDDPALRVRYGEDFESIISEDDKAGTKVNMLTDRVLDGVNFPEIRLEGSGFEGSLDDASLPVSIQMLGRTIERTFAASISVTEDSVTVEGEHRLTHADLGMEVFSLLGGAMAVGAEIDITYRLQAEAVAQ